MKIVRNNNIYVADLPCYGLNKEESPAFCPARRLTILLFNVVLPNFLARRGFVEARRYRKYAAELDIVIRR